MNWKSILLYSLLVHHPNVVLPDLQFDSHASTVRLMSTVKNEYYYLSEETLDRLQKGY